MYDGGVMWTRRTWLKTAVGGGGALAGKARAELARMKITRIRFYHSPISRPIFNQSSHIVTVETDQGITGIGEGGSRDTIVQCAGLLIGRDPSRIENLWQLMYRGHFYPPGREKIHALGALDVALWDIKGKALGVPVYELLGGLTRDYVECYATGFPSQIREGVGDDGDWAIDYHTRLDFPDAVRLSTLLEPLEPLFCEDLVRSENKGVYRQLRPQVKVPIAHELVENQLIDYSRVTIPNVGGITEMMKLAALCETHYVGLVPHFTGPASEAALVHVLASFPGPALMEMTGAGPRDVPYFPQHFDFKNGKLWPNRRPGIGVEFDPSRVKLVAEITEPSQPVRVFHRPDGSITNW